MSNERLDIAYVILGILEKRGPSSGYEIKQFVDHSTRFFWAASYGQIYPELARLDAERLVSARDAPTGGRRRTVYRLTAHGRAALRRWVSEPAEGHEFRELALLKLFFADGDEAARARVRDVREEHEATLERLQAIGAGVGDRMDPAARLVHEFGVGLHGWIVEWCRATEAAWSEPA